MGSKLDYGTSNIISITLAGLANDTYAISTAIDNSSTKWIAADIIFYFKTATVSGNDPYVALFALRSVDGGTVYDDINDAALVLGVFPGNVNNTTFAYSVDTSSVMYMLPDFFKLAVKNFTGSALDAAPSSHQLALKGKRFTTLNHFV